MRSSGIILGNRIYSFILGDNWRQSRRKLLFKQFSSTLASIIFLTKLLNPVILFNSGRTRKRERISYYLTWLCWNYTHKNI